MTMIYSCYHYSSATEKGIAFVNIVIISVTLVIVAVPEGQTLYQVIFNRLTVY
jgi:hypothetical protein